MKRIRGIILVTVPFLFFFLKHFPLLPPQERRAWSLIQIGTRSHISPQRELAKSIGQPVAQTGAQTSSTSNAAGTYRIGIKYGPKYRSKTYPLACYQPCKDGTCKPKSACGAAMPHFMKFAGKRFGIHAGTVSRNNSHGCIHVPSSVARFLSDTLPIGTPVTVLPYIYQ